MPHIPQGTTDTLTLELFAPALEAALRPSPDYDVSRWLYVPNTYSEYRYILGTRGTKPLICQIFRAPLAEPLWTSYIFPITILRQNWLLDIWPCQIIGIHFIDHL